MGIHSVFSRWKGTMRVILAVSCLVALVLSQTTTRAPPPAWWAAMQGIIGSQTDVVDQVHGYRFEYHAPANGTHLMIVIKDKPPPKECHFIEISRVWEPLLNDVTKLSMMTEEIYGLVTNNATRETTLNIQQLYAAYGDADAARECYGHSLKILGYTPSAMVQAGK